MTIVPVEQISADARSLRHPIEPYTAVRVMDVIVIDQHIDGGVDLDPGHFGAREKLADVDLVDLVAADRAEYRAQAADDARLLAVEDLVVADDVRADGFL